MAEVAKNKIAWLSGSYLARRHTEQLMRVKFKDYGLFICSSETIFDNLMIALQTNGVFETKRLVIIRELPFFLDDGKKKKSLDKLKKVLSSLDESIFVIFNGIEKTKEKALFTHVSSLGKEYAYEDRIDARDAPYWIIERCKLAGYKIEIGEASAIAESCGYDPALQSLGTDILDMSLKRLYLYLGDKKEITITDIYATSFIHEKFIVWDLANAFDVKDYDKCLSLLHSMTALDDNLRSAAIGSLSGLLWRYRLILFLKERLTNCKDMADIRGTVVADALQMRKLSQSGFGDQIKMTPDTYEKGDNAGKTIPAWGAGVISMYLDGSYGRGSPVDAISRKDAYRIIRCLQDILLALRSSDISDGDIHFLLNVLFMTACGNLDDNNLQTITQSLVKREMNV